MPAAALQTIALFRFPGQESADNARRLAVTVRAAGYEVQVFGFWPDGCAATDNDQFLLETDLGSAQRMSAWAFRNKHGFEIDTLRLSAHTFATEPLRAEIILAESVLHQRLRGFADLVAEALNRVRPSHVLVPHGAEILSRIVNAVSAHHQYPLLFWESGFLPDHLYVDHRAPHFFRGLCSADQVPPSTSAQAFGAELRGHWLARGLSKYEQSGKDDARFSQWLTQRAEKVLFIPAQVPTDANVVTGLNHHLSLADLYRDMIDQVPAGWRVVFKPHPKADVDWSTLLIDDNRLFVGDVSIMQAIQASDAVLAHSSNAGLEALLLGRPVLTTGSPIYGRNGLTYAISTGSDLPGVLQKAQPAPQQDVEKLLGHLTQMVLVADGDANSLVAKLNASQPVLDDYLPHYPTSLRNTVQAALALDKRLRLNEPIDVAFSNLEVSVAGRLTNALTPDILTARPFGGPLMGEQWQPPLLGDARRNEELPAYPHIENLPSPELKIEELCRGSGAKTFSVRLSPDGTSADIQSFTVASLTALIRATGIDFEILSWPDGDYVTVYLQPSHPLSLADKTTVRLPATVFKAGGSAKMLHAGDELSLTTKHAHYGPYTSLPAGQWSIAHQSPASKHRYLSAWTKLTVARKMKLQILEHANGSEPRIIHETCWLKPTGHFQTRQGYKYELRAFMPKAKSRSKGPRFYGFALSSADTTSVTRLMSAP